MSSRSRPSTRTKLLGSRQGTIKTENPELLPLLDPNPESESQRSISVKAVKTPRSDSVKDALTPRTNRSVSETKGRNSVQIVDDVNKENNEEKNENTNESGYFQKEAVRANDISKTVQESATTDQSENVPLQPISRPSDNKASHEQDPEVENDSRADPVTLVRSQRGDSANSTNQPHEKLKPTFSATLKTNIEPNEIDSKAPQINQPEAKIDSEERLKELIAPEVALPMNESGDFHLNSELANEDNTDKTAETVNGNENRQVTSPNPDTSKPALVSKGEPYSTAHIEAGVVSDGLGDSDRETLKSAGSSSSELARLRSPSRKSLNFGFADADSDPTSPVLQKDEKNSRDVDADAGSATPVPAETSPSPKNATPVNEALPTSRSNVSDHPVASLTPRFTAYSSQRLKARGDTAKRSSAVSQSYQSEAEGRQSFAADSLDFERDSLEVTSEEAKPPVDIKKSTEKEKEAEEEVRLSKDSLQEEKEDNFDEKEKEDASEKPVSPKSSEKQETPTPPTPTPPVKAPTPPAQNSEPKPNTTVTKETKKAWEPDQNSVPVLLKPPTPASAGNLVERENTLVEQSREAPSVNPQDRELQGPDTDRDSDHGERDVHPEERDQVEFVLRTDPTKSRYASAQGTGRFSNVSVSRRSSAGQVSQQGWQSSRTTPSSKKVYVESPTFTREEEEEYRFVSSRLEGEEGEDGRRPDTYREMDIAAVQRQDNFQHAGQPPAVVNTVSNGNMAGEKRVRYSDLEQGGRYEDRDEEVLGFGRNDSLDYEMMGGRNDGELVNENAGFPGVDHYGRRNIYDNEPPRGNGAESNDDTRQNRYQDRNDENARPAFDKQHGSRPDPRQQSNNYNNDSTGPRAQQPPAALSLPIKQDPEEEEELRRESEYQTGLRNRIEDTTRKVSQISNPPQLSQNRRDFYDGSNPQQAPYQNRGPYQDQGQSQGPYQSQDPYQGQPQGQMYFQGQPQGPYQGQPQGSYRGQSQAPYQGQPQGPYQSQGQPQGLYQSQVPPQGGYQSMEDSWNFTRDSLEDGRPGPVARRDSLELYRGDEQRESQDYDNTGISQPHLNPQVRPRFYHQAGSQEWGEPLESHRSGHPDDRSYQQQPPPQHIQQQQYYQQQQPPYYNQQQQLQQYYPQQQPPSQQGPPGNYYPYNDVDGGQDTSRSGQDQNGNAPKVPGLEGGVLDTDSEKPHRFDYVNTNKEDYGKQRPKTYQKLHEISKEEKERANDLFIKPKVKSKGILKKRSQSQGGEDSQHHSPGPESRGYGDQETPGLEEEMSAAEQLWARRASTLASGTQGRRGARGRGRGDQPPQPQQQRQFKQAQQQQRPPPQQQQQQPPQQYGSQQRPPPQQQQYPQQQQQLQQYSKQPQQQQQHQHPPALPPDKRAFLTEMPTPVNEQNQMHHHPRSPRIQHGQEIVLQPITQQVITDDGQRISVDVNLRLISPPPIGGGSPQYQQQHQQKQYKDYNRQPRQYPAVAQYDVHQYQENYNDYDAEVDGYSRGGGYGGGGGGGYNRGYAKDFQTADYDHPGQTPRERYSADEALRALSESRTDMNPFGKVPPIPRSSDGLPSSAPAEQSGSYMESYLKEKNRNSQKPWYRVYGLKDYRKMQKEVRLGTLGPDLDTAERKERKDKVNRQQEYARVINERNRSQLVNKKPPAFPRPKEENDILNRHRVAKEYAKTVPKPTVRMRPNAFNNYEIAAEQSPIAKHHRRIKEVETPSLTSYTASTSFKGISPSPSGNTSKAEDIEVLNIEKLRQRYEEDKQNEALIRRNSSREHY